MPSRVNGISNLRIKLALVPRPSAKVRLVHRKPSLSASATLSTICSAVEKRRSIIDFPHHCHASPHICVIMYLIYLHLIGINVSHIGAFEKGGLPSAPQLCRSTTCPPSNRKSLTLSKSCSSRLGSVVSICAIAS